MTPPKYIYTYWQGKYDSCAIMKHEIRIYKPYMGMSTKKLSLGDELFDIEAQSNTDTDHARGLRRAYGIRVSGLQAGHPDSFKLASKLVADIASDGGMPALIKKLHKLGAVRFALGDVKDPKSYNGREWMPRKYANKNKSVAYWNAINAGLELPI